ncbi:MAG: hypothetical protein R2824_17960 [Saprospiraceae bacterium]
MLQKKYTRCKQIIKIGDSKPPKVKCEEVDYDNDGPLTCARLPVLTTAAAFHVPMPGGERQLLHWEVLTEIVAYGTDGVVVATILPGATRVSGIPLGCHYIKYSGLRRVVTKRLNTAPFYVEDQVAPSQYRDDDLHFYRRPGTGSRICC